MLAKLDLRYDSKSSAAKIAKRGELVSVRYTSAQNDMIKHVCSLAGLVEQLAKGGPPLDSTLAVRILEASIHVDKLMPVTAFIKTLAEKDLNREDFSSHFIEEEKSLRSGNDLPGRVAPAKTARVICHGTTHPTYRCSLNSLDPNNRFNVP